jgi:hypothetical protein
MWRVILWTVGGAAVGWIATLATIIWLLGDETTARMNRAGRVCLTVLGLLPGAGLGAIFGLADTLLREQRALRDEIAKRRPIDPGT